MIVILTGNYLSW